MIDFHMEAPISSDKPLTKLFLYFHVEWLLTKGLNRLREERDRMGYEPNRDRRKYIENSRLSYLCIH